MCPPSSLYFDEVFANAGDRTTVPDPTQSNGTVSYESGFPIGYSTPVAAGGFNFPRNQHNQILNDVTAALQLMQQNGCFSFITSTMNGGSPYSYNLGALCLYNAGSGEQVWLSTSAANTTTPGAMGAFWVPLSSGSFSLSNQTHTGASYEYSIANAGAVVHRSNSGAAMGDTLPGTSAGLPPAGTTFIIANDDASAMMSITAASGVTLNGASGDISYIGPKERKMFETDGTNWFTATSVPRAKLGANTIFYVANGGSDTANDGLTTATAWATFQHAYNFIASNIDGGGFNINLQFYGSGTYTANITCSVATVPANTTVIFDGASQTVSVTSEDCFTLIGDGINVTLQNMKLQTTTSGNCISYGNGAHLTTGVGINFGACAGQHISGNPNSEANLTQNYTISGGAINHWAVEQGARIEVSGLTITLSGTPVFSSPFASVQESAGILCLSNTFSGAATGVQYIAQLNGTINTDGATTNWPTGLTSGTTATGGQII